MSDPKPIPDASYPCRYCWEDQSWPAKDLHWADEVSDWVCPNCWSENVFKECGISLEAEISKRCIKATSHSFTAWEQVWIAFNAAADDVERLEHWKNEAMQVLAQWDEVWIASGAPETLGQSKAAAVLKFIQANRTTPVDA